MALAFEGGLALVASGLGWLVGHPPLDEIEATWSGLGFGLVATLPMAVVFWALVKFPVGPLGNLAVPIIAHGAYDFLALAYLVKLRGTRNEDAEADPS